LISFVLGFFGILLGTLIPAYISLYLIPNLKVIDTKYLAAAGIGLTFWFFLDTMLDAAKLDVDESVYPISAFGGVSHIAIVIVFLAGISTLALLDHFVSSNPASNLSLAKEIRKNSSWGLFVIPFAVALVMGIHGLGEGWDFGSVASSAQTTDLVSTFGNIASVVSYPIHKFLEAAIIALVYTCFVVRAKVSVKRNWWHIPLLGLLFGGPSVIGASFGYFVQFDTTYFYAFGVTSALYVIIRLDEALTPGFQVAENGPLRLGEKVFLALAIGFLLLYGAALLH
jgi:zinc transporter ZupT